MSKNVEATLSPCGGKKGEKTIFNTLVEDVGVV